MFGKFLVPSALFISIATVVGMTATAQAAEIEVPFSGSIKAACEFSKPTAGVLTPNDATLPTQLSSKNVSGAAGQVSVKCNTPAVVTAQSYAATNDAAKNLKVAKATYTVSNGKEDAASVKVGMGTTPIGVSLTLDSTDAIPAGDYSYNVTVTATP
jgi:hypothetical protein